jgi:hypothetical protein
MSYRSFPCPPHLSNHLSQLSLFLLPSHYCAGGANCPSPPIMPHCSHASALPSHAFIILQNNALCHTTSFIICQLDTTFEHSPAAIHSVLSTWSQQPRSLSVFLRYPDKPFHPSQLLILDSQQTMASEKAYFPLGHTSFLRGECSHGSLLTMH